MSILGGKHTTMKASSESKYSTTMSGSGDKHQPLQNLTLRCHDFVLYRHRSNLQLSHTSKHSPFSINLRKCFLVGCCGRGICLNSHTRLLCTLHFLIFHGEPIDRDKESNRKKREHEDVNRSNFDVNRDGDDQNEEDNQRHIDDWNQLQR